MLLSLDLSDQRPLHEQAADAIRRAIATGEVAPGDRLPPARDLAAALQINSNTVLRALRQLRAEGLLEFRRGRGVTVLRRPDPAAQLREQLSELVEQAGRLGYGPEEVIEWIKRDAGLPRETEQP
ncbi:GntR family transcriptional regulator [Saccharopolyspora rectivirgula]|jgi:GntR family transcriptional regulator|uniref:GntR family transcriptional regulator n=1 Tax=Saccharopolyspora rectivirgula TaxID=28042 RepID=A0A073AV98_9PSEU|nr:GntR family transcriptional regulator [Saccharopolyspora rectivirgula]KEI43012.1 GntR family transcriptional regulator [Saccharopolyspora rectivirgula]